MPHDCTRNSEPRYILLCNVSLQTSPNTAHARTAIAEQRLKSGERSNV